MEVWEGKIKGYNQSGNYVGTYQAVVEKEGDLSYKMTVYFDRACTGRREMNHKLKENPMYSSSLEVLKRSFRKAVSLQVKSKTIWKRKSLDR